MSIFSCLSNIFGSGYGSSFSDDFAINPANGNPMVGGIGGLDIAGNPFGTDFSNDHMTSSTFDDNWSSFSCENFSSTDNFSDW